MYLAEQGQLDMDAFNLLGFWNRRGIDSVCPTTSTVTSPAEMPYLAFIAQLYHGIEATICQAELNVSAFAHLIGGGDSGSAQPQAAVTRRRVLIGREVLVYLAEQGQLDMDAFNLLGFRNRRGTDSVCPTTSTVTSPAEMPYLAFIAQLYHGIEATICQVELNVSAFAHLIGGGDSGSAEPQAAVTGRRVLIGREVLVYLAEQGQLDMDAFNLLGFWNRRGTDSVCPTTSTVTSPAEMPYLAFIAQLYHGVDAPSCQAK